MGARAPDFLFSSILCLFFTNFNGELAPGLNTAQSLHMVLNLLKPVIFKYPFI